MNWLAGKARKKSLFFVIFMAFSGNFGLFFDEFACESGSVARLNLNLLFDGSILPFGVQIIRKARQGFLLLLPGPQMRGTGGTHNLIKRFMRPGPPADLANTIKKQLGLK